MANTYSAGIVTAYGAAVRGGYTGTYEEFCAQQATFAENAEQVAEDRAAVEQIKITFENQTVPAAVQQVSQVGAAQVQAVQAAGAAEASDIAAAGTAQEAAVNTAGAAQVQAVQTAGSTQVTAVQGAGTTQVAAVNAAGASQVDAVEDKGAEVLASIPQDYSALTGEVDALKSALDETVNFKENFFNPETAVRGAFCAGDVGGALRPASNSGYAYNVIPVKYGTTYIVSKSSYAWFEFDANMIGLHRLGDSTERTDFEYTPTDSNVKYVAFSWQPSASPISTYMVTLKGVSRASYIPYPSVAKLTDEVMAASGIENEKIYTVGSGKDFTSFTACLEALQGDTSRKAIYIYSGEYDIFEELGGKSHMESLDVSAGARAAQFWVPQNTRVVGVGDVLLKFNPSDEDIIDYNHGWLMSPLNISGSCEVENIAVEGSNCRYAIHIEANGANDDANTATIVLKNVRAKRTSTPLMGVHQVIGTGIGFDANWRLENCRIVGDAGAPGFSVHTNAPNSMESATVVLENCIFDTLDGQPTTNMLVKFISQYLPVAITNYAFVNNCFVRGKVGTDTTTTPYRQSFKVAVNGGVSNGLVNAPNMQSGYTVENYGNRTL